MRLFTARRGAMAAVVVTAAMVVSVLPAAAAPGDGSAYGLKVAVSLLGQPAVNVGPLSYASTSGPTSASVVSASVPGVITTGVINASATRNDTTGEVTSRASTADVALPLLSAVGTVSASLIVATCDATQSGETGSATLANVNLGSLGTVAANPSPNTVISVRLLGVTIATLTFNEQIHNADGSLTVNALHVHLLGGVVGSLGSGDVIISSATCGPAALPIPMASGTGLWLGLLILGAIAVPVAVVGIRRRNRQRSTTV